MAQQKPIVFQGSGYRVIRSDPRNVILEVLTKNDEGKEVYQFRGYFGTIEAALGSLVTNSLLVDETKTMNAASYRKAIMEMKNQIISDIKGVFNSSTSSDDFDIEDDELFN